MPSPSFPLPRVSRLLGFIVTGLSGRRRTGSVTGVVSGVTAALLAFEDVPAHAVVGQPLGPALGRAEFLVIVDAAQVRFRHEAPAVALAAAALEVLTGAVGVEAEVPAAVSAALGAEVNDAGDTRGLLERDVREVGGVRKIAP